ncbi:MAG: phosphopantothenoylcysteine decarboxylase [Opitutae bacterium]|nr:phosphopantothenoylcysteine decarboxylase [Opitutae bacterium]
MAHSDEDSSKGTLDNRVICLGVTGSIAAYKSADLTSELRRQGAEVFVVMTRAAREFVGSSTFQTLSRNPVTEELWNEGDGWQPGHIELADKTDLLLVAPATAHSIAQFANGLAGDALTSIYLATTAKVMLAPAMNGKMYQHPATQDNLSKLRERDHLLVDPEEGELACGYEGVGRMASVDSIVAAVLAALA